MRGTKEERQKVMKVEDLKYADFQVLLYKATKSVRKQGKEAHASKLEQV